ncbi:MAG: Stp1/IreP family PP2C-type Ser/Thr phosphatase [Candidatus Binatia bacterium]
MKLEPFALSDVGLVRRDNEDSSALLPERGLFLVADGMGGAAGGKRASQTAVEAIGERLAGAEPAGSEALLESVLEANRRIFAMAAADSSLKGMGTTIVALLVEDERTGVVLNVGDSRIYRLRGEVFEQLTRDHSFVADLLRRNDISEDEARSHPYRHMLTRALGVSEEVTPDVRRVDLADGDLYLLCSDGVYGMMSPEDLRRIVAENRHSAESVCRELIAAARNGGGRDNATVVAVRLGADS